jgi:cytochrome c
MLMRQCFFAALAFALFCNGTEAFAEQPGNIAAGHQLARLWCSECHQVDAKRRHVKRPAPAASFLEIASEPSITPLSLRVFFQSSHENMPNLHISTKQADDLVAYILSLKRR